MNEIRIFLLGFGLWYLIQVADIIINLLNSYASVTVSKNNTKINELSELDQQQTNVMGFQYQPEEYYEDEWEDEYL